MKKEEKKLGIISRIKASKYYEAVEAGFWRIWKNKTIWFWGLLVSSGIYLNFSGNHKEEEKTLEEGFVGDFLANYWGWVVFGVFAFLILMLLIWVISAVARSGVIKEFDTKQNNERHRLTFKGVWKIGKKDFKKILGLDLWLLGIVLGILTFDLILLMLAFIVDLTVLAIFIAVFLGLATILFLIVLVILKPVATILLVLANLTIKNSFFESWNLLRANLKEYFKLILTLLVISIMGGVVVTLVLLIGGTLLVGLFGIAGGFLGKEIPFLITFSMIVIGSIVLFGVLAVEGFLNLWKMDILIWWVKMIKAVKINKKKPVTKKRKLSKKNRTVQEKKELVGVNA